ncbi:MAG: hypothetical protein KJ025_04190 [Burkholderiales bacterium]|nr:hypothetical protein [Burkholderiales bacterium]
MTAERHDYDRLAEGQDAEVEITVLAVTEAPGGVPVMLAKVDQTQVELWAATPGACSAARHVARGAHVAAHITKCPEVISDRRYGGLRKSPELRIRFARLLELRPA